MAIDKARSVRRRGRRASAEGHPSEPVLSREGSAPESESSDEPPSWSPLVEQRDNRDGDHEMRRAYELHGNLLALHTALRVSYTMPVPGNATPYPADMYFVPTWVVDACYDIVSKELTTAAQGTGRNARWLTRYRNELRDQGRWRVFSWCRANGLSQEEAWAATATFLGESDSAVRAAVRRVTKRQRVAAHFDAECGVGPNATATDAPVFRPVPQPWQREDPSNSPALEHLWREDAWENLDAFLRVLTNTSPTPHEGEQAARGRRLLGTVAAFQARRGTAK